MGIRNTVANTLATDATLAGLLTGGIYSDEGEISREGTPGAFDGNKELLPCALVKTESETQYGPLNTSSRMYLVIYFYQRRGYATIEAAIERVYTLLNMQKLGIDRVWEIRHADDMPNLQDQALDCSLAMSRYTVTRRR